MTSLQVFGLYLSTYVIVIISIDRCLAIVDPISKNRAPRRVRLMLLLAWVFSAAFSIPQVCPSVCVRYTMTVSDNDTSFLIVKDAVKASFKFDKK